jgi:UDP-glucuronate 4-epimerase
MALFLFTKAILDGDPIKVFNFGEMMRDFTYIDDIVSGTIGALDHPASDQETGVPHAVYNLGNHRSEPLMRMIELLEDCLGKKAEKIMEPIQPGDVAETFADIEPARRDLGFDPKTSIEVGIPAFVDWYRDYFGIA